jgi:hypothetical protein
LGYGIKGLKLTLEAYYIPKHVKHRLIPERIIFLLTSDSFNHPTVEKKLLAQNFSPLIGAAYL